MLDIPQEGTAAGNVLAGVALLTPLLAIVVTYHVKAKLKAVLASLAVCALVTGSGAYFALSVAPGEGTEMGAAIIGGWSIAISVLMTALVLGVKVIYERSPLDTSAPVATGAVSGNEEGR